MIDVLVSTCSSYRDTWPILARAMQKIGVSSQFKIWCICTSPTDADHLPSGWNAIDIQYDRGWSDNIIYAAGKLDAEYLLLWLDDIVPVAMPSVDDVKSFLEGVIEKLDPAYLRLSPKPKGSVEALSVGEVVVYRIDEGAPYRNSTILPVWKRKMLLEHLVPNESAWDFEVYGTERVGRVASFYCLNKALIPTANLVVKGRLEPESKRRVEDFGIPVQTNRKLLSGHALAKLRLKELAHKIASNFFPAKVFKAIQYRKHK